eukprot:scaffold431_cov334-Pavlova_lutheri.AAC.5
MEGIFLEECRTAVSSEVAKEAQQVKVVALGNERVLDDPVRRRACVLGGSPLIVLDEAQLRLGHTQA